MRGRAHGKAAHGGCAHGRAVHMEGLCTWAAGQVTRARSAHELAKALRSLLEPRRCRLGCRGGAGGWCVERDDRLHGGLHGGFDRCFLDGCHRLHGCVLLHLQPPRLLLRLKHEVLKCRGGWRGFEQRHVHLWLRYLIPGFLHRRLQALHLLLQRSGVTRVGLGSFGPAWLLRRCLWDLTGDQPQSPREVAVVQRRDTAVNEAVEGLLWIVYGQPELPEPGSEILRGD